MTGPIQTEPEAILSAVRSDLLCAAQRVAARGRSRRRRRFVLILVGTVLVPTVALATTDTNPLDWFSHTDSRIGFGFVVDPVHVPPGVTYTALTCTVGGRDCAPWPRVVCTPQIPAAPDCNTSRAPRPRAGQQGYALLEVAEPVRKVSRMSALALIASRPRTDAQTARALDTIAAAVRRVPDGFWPAVNRLLSVQAFTITIGDPSHPDRILVPPRGVPGFLRCLPGRQARCRPLTPGDHVAAGTALYEALRRDNWISVPQPPQNALLYYRALSAQLGHPVTPDEVWALEVAFASSNSQLHIGGSESSQTSSATITSSGRP